MAAIQTDDPVWTDIYIFEHLRVAIKEDATLRPILAFFQNVKQAPLDVRRRFQEYTLYDGLLRFRDLIYVPDDEELKQQILRSRHDALAAGHQGRTKTLELVMRTFY